MAGSGALQWRNRHAPCPTDPKLRDACLRTRKVSFAVYLVSVAFYLIGGWFAFVQPWLASDTIDGKLATFVYFTLIC